MPSPNASSSQLDNVFRALGDPTRQAIIERLADCPASVSELAAPFDMSLPAIYQHLQILRDAGLVQTIKAGRIRTCRLEVRALRRAERWLSERRSMWEHRLDALAEHLSRDKTRPGGRRSP
jgi:DNA-binding transcriptional ArsR family regulator